jgi:hypothetical protein
MSDLPKRSLTPEQKRAIVERVLVAWEKSPQLRLGQMIYSVSYAALTNADNAGRDLFFIEDTDLAELLETWRNV